jgi:hypothetical protein
VQKTNKIITLKDWCNKNGYDGVNKECLLSAYQSENPNIVKLAKREKLKGLVSEGVENG